MMVECFHCGKEILPTQPWIPNPYIYWIHKDTLFPECGTSAERDAFTQSMEIGKEYTIDKYAMPTPAENVIDNVLAKYL